MAGTWLLLLLALGCPALPTGVGSTPFPSLAPPITLLVDGKQQTLVVCLVLDVAPPGLESPIWFSAGNGSALDAFTYGPSPAADGTWTSLAQLSLPSEELEAWENLVCHTGPGTGDSSQSTQPLQLSETPGQALRLGALRLLLFKLLLFDVLLTCSRLRALPAVRGSLSRAPGPGDPRLPAPLTGPQPLPIGEPSNPTDWSRRSEASTTGRGLIRSAPPMLQPRATCRVHTRCPGPNPRSPVWEEGTLPTGPVWTWCSGPALNIPASSLGAFVCDLPPPADRSFLSFGLCLPNSS
ncbi:Pre T-cell antigen receptor alpha [Pteropus alecto]|nr:Pre T-cell antigen receptor alpha [Pteropus alecto]